LPETQSGDPARRAATVSIRPREWDGLRRVQRGHAELCQGASGAVWACLWRSAQSALTEFRNVDTRFRTRELKLDGRRNARSWERPLRPLNRIRAVQSAREDMGTKHLSHAPARSCRCGNGRHGVRASPLWTTRLDGIPLDAPEDASR